MIGLLSALVKAYSEYKLFNSRQIIWFVWVYRSALKMFSLENIFIAANKAFVSFHKNLSHVRVDESVLINIFIDQR